MHVATILVVGDGAILHQVESPHWFVIGIGEPGAHIGDVGLAVAGHIHRGLLCSDSTKMEKSSVSQYGTSLSFLFIRVSTSSTLIVAIPIDWSLMPKGMTKFSWCTTPPQE